MSCTSFAPYQSLLLAFNIAYVKGEHSILRNDGSVEKSWKGYFICNAAILDPNNAWIEAQSLISSQLDPGISKSQVLFWVSTREGFSPSTTAEISSDNKGGDDDDVQSSSTQISPAVPEEISPAASEDQRAPPVENKKPNAAKPNKDQSSLASCTSHEKCVAQSLKVIRLYSYWQILLALFI